MTKDKLNGVSAGSKLRVKQSGVEAIEQIVVTMRSLKKNNPKKFVELAHQFEREALEVQETFVGEDHPFARLFATPRDPESIQRLEEGIKEYREMIESSGV